MSSLWPLFERFPELRDLPRVTLRTAVTPVIQVEDRLWIKRDDLTANPIGGNKVRALEFLLGGVPPGSRIITGGSRGSTHVLATMVHAHALGIAVLAAAWPQEMNSVAHVVDARIGQDIKRRQFRSPVTAALWLTWQAWRGRRVIPAGGTSPLGILGQVNAAMELAEQINAGLLPVPERVVVPLGTGGTMAGLSLGFSVAGLSTTVVGARVVPRIVANASRVRRLMRATARMMEKPVGGRKISFDAPSIEIVESVYGGAYGRPLPGAPALASTGIPLDPTYSAKAFVAAIESGRTSRTLFWHTFDARWMNE